MLAILSLFLFGIRCALVDDIPSSTPQLPLKLGEFPILPTYYQPSCRAIWFSLIHPMVGFYVTAYKSLLEDNDGRGEAYEVLQAVNFGNALWQVFAPGSKITSIDVEEEFVVDEILTEYWRPLKGGQDLFTYSKSKGTSHPRKVYKLSQPSGVNVSYLMQPLKEDPAVLHILHLTSCEPTLNTSILHSITQRFSVTFTQNSVIGVQSVKLPNLEEILEIKKMVNGMTFPGRFPMNDASTNGGISLDKQIRAGFIPTLGDYSLNTTGLSHDSYTQMLQRIIAVMIQSCIHLPFGGRVREMSTLIIMSQRYLQRIFPNCTVQHYMTRSYKKPMQLVSLPKDKVSPVTGFVLDCRECPKHSSRYRLLGEGEQGPPPFCTIVLNFGPNPTCSITIRDFLWFRKSTFPNAVPLKPRRFAGLSTDIYNNALLELNLKNSIYPNARDYGAIIMDCLTLFAMNVDHFTNFSLDDVSLELPGRDTHLLRLEALELRFSEPVRYVVQPNVVYPSHTTIAYNEHARFMVAVPFVLVRMPSGEGDFPPKLIVMKHADEGSEKFTNTGTFFRVMYQ